LIKKLENTGKTSKKEPNKNTCTCIDMVVVTKVIGNNEERKRNHSTETQDFNVENPPQQREVKTMGVS
jgi:hypothetical protein